jgi:hypothetical protein
MADETYIVAVDLVSRGKPQILQSAPTIVNAPGQSATLMQGVFAGVVGGIFAKGLMKIIPKSSIKQKTKANSLNREHIAKIDSELTKVNTKKVLGVKKAIVFVDKNQTRAELTEKVEKKAIRNDLKATVIKLNINEKQLFSAEAELKVTKDMLKIERQENIVGQVKVKKLESEIAFIINKKETQTINRSMGQQIRRQREAIQMGNDPKPLNDPRVSKEAAWAKIQVESKVKVIPKQDYQEVNLPKPSRYEQKKKFKENKSSIKEEKEEIDMEDYLEKERRSYSKLTREERAEITVE